MSVQMRKFRALDRRRKVVGLYASGVSQSAIAEQLGVDRATVSRDLALMREEWKKTVRRDYQELCDRELMRLNLLEREAWDNWDWENAPVTESGEKRYGSKSRWKYLEVIIRCSAQRRRLLALDGPHREPKSPEEELAEEERGREEIERLLVEIREMEAAEKMDNG